MPGSSQLATFGKRTIPGYFPLVTQCIKQEACLHTQVQQLLNRVVELRAAHAHAAHAARVNSAPPGANAMRLMRPTHPMHAMRATHLMRLMHPTHPMRPMHPVLQAFLLEPLSPAVENKQASCVHAFAGQDWSPALPHAD